MLARINDAVNMRMLEMRRYVERTQGSEIQYWRSELRQSII